MRGNPRNLRNPFNPRFRHGGVVKVLAEKAVFFLKREPAFELLYFQDEFVQFHRVSPFKHFHSALAPLT